MAAYRADIEIGVKGLQQLQSVTKQINSLAAGVDGINKRLSGATQSINAYNANLSRAAQTLNKVSAGTLAEADAIKQYVIALGQANAARDRQNKLIQEQIALQRKAVPTANAGFGMQGPALPPSATRAGGGVMRGRIGGAISGGVIGGAFPLLFGQGGGAATGGAIGGFLGGLAGPGGSFAGSLLGTLLGDIASKGQAVKQLGQDLGFSAQQTQTLATAFKTANTDVEKFTAVIQNIKGVGLELEDQVKAIQLVTKLSENYKASFEKVGNAITSALESGKVSQATLNQLTSQGIDIQGALADKLRVSRDSILEMAKKGRISVQDLINTLVDLGNKPADIASKTQTASQQLQTAMSNLTKIVGPELERLTKLFVEFGTVALNALNNVLIRLGQVGAGIENAIAGDTLKNATEQFRRDANVLKSLYQIPKENRTPAQVKRIGVLEKLQQGRSEVIRAAQTPKTTPLQTFKPPSQLASSGGGDSNKAERAAAREQARVAELVRSQRLITLEYQNQQKANEKIFAAEMTRDPMLARRLEGERQLVEWGIETADLLEKESSAAGQLAIAKAQQAKQGLIIQKTDQDLARLEKQRKENAQNTILGLKQELDLRKATTEVERNRLRIQYEMDALSRGKQYTDPELQQIEALKNQLAAPETAGEIIQKRIGALQDELTKLTNIGNIAVSVADSIGTAFSQAFQGIISGTMTAQEALASFFQSVGDAFIQMAAEIIAKQLTMIILQTILKALGGGGGFNAGASSAVGAGLLNPATMFDAFAFTGRAGGGAVKAATPYLVGERGPELFVPGTSGGVMSNSDLRASMGAAPGSSGGPVLNMTFETSTINGVEYVSRDQLEAAMAVTRRQAARDGASRGMTMTLDRLQQSPSTRRKVGI